MRYYAIADLHGRFDLLEKAFEAITKDILTSDVSGPSTIITLGDYIDRGPASKQIIDKLIYQQDSSLGNSLICLKGNHEDMVVQTITQPLMPSWWMSNGGLATIQSYNPQAYWGETGWVNEDHVKWMGSLPLFYETEKHVFVHAGVPADDLDLKDQDGETLMWMLYSKTDSGGYRGKHVVHGHHQFADGPHEWEGRTDLDCYAWRTGRLVVGVFDDTQGKALKFLEVLGDDYADERQQLVL